MDFKQAERHFQELKKQRIRGELDEDAFHVEVAKLMFRDERGIFWMLDADTGGWFRNRGEGWMPGDPGTEGASEVEYPAARSTRRRWFLRVVALGMVLGLVLGMVALVILWQSPTFPGNLAQPAATQEAIIQVTIASPADGSQVALEQEVAIESTINAAPDLRSVDRVELRVNGQVVDTQPVRPKAQPVQTSLPLSQPWLPTDIGEHEVKVVALSAESTPLGEAVITLYVEEAPSETLPEPACVPDSTFVTDVTIPPGTAFPPNARMDKVWQVRNSGSCAWGVGYKLVHLEGERLGAPGSVSVPPTAAGDPADLTVTFWAPVEAGAYVNVWQLRSPDGAFFGPTLTLDIQVEVLAEESLPPNAPTNLQSEVTEDGKAVRLTWVDQSDNEDAFRIYREDVEASIGLAPADAQLFVDEGVACGNAYRYAVVAFNAAGASPIGEAAEVVLPACAPANEPPALALTIVPTQVTASEVFTVTFLAEDDVGMDLVVVWGDETGDPLLDRGRVFTCTEVICSESWPITWTRDVSVTLTVVAVARDATGQESEQAWATVDILPPQEVISPTASPPPP
jgi:hypothetical protein